MVTENNVKVIQFNQFIHITKVVYKCHEKLSKRLRDKFDDDRRSLYLKKDWIAYEQYVCDQHNKDGKALDDIIAMILRELDLK